MIKFTKTRPVKSPQRANSYDAGTDFFVPDDYPETVIAPNGSILIPCGIKVDVPAGYALIFNNKSGIASKRKLLVGACVIDHGYQGECHINLHNVGSEHQIIKPGEKIVQAVLLQVHLDEFVECTIESMYINADQGRGEGGFGSTGLV